MVTKGMRTFAVKLFSFLALSSCAPLSAATLNLLTGSLEYYFASPSGVSEIRGTAGLAVNDPGFIGAILSSDNGAPFPNATLTSVDLAITQSVLQTFDFANQVLIGTDVFIPVIGVPLSPLTEPALVSILKPIVYRFSLTDQVPDGNGGTVFVFSFQDAASSSVPEPASVAFASMGVAALFFVKRRNSRSAAR